ncbi:hypothetical protein SISSUDRAFT_1053345 [Sistotremastrum suecicum HHB10207 ss-3]|uniref:Uncharacterized protein n=1 Tax=Sistotremastrum suecicum HHB10207 ss-3 TaxID=1314776 RepID=A0A165ZA97_9AGAM|nr:hypothetical protein SISSUDRAFT_1053345 [Sistotremastrum suecicum HHB10207 ss-3]
MESSTDVLRQFHEYPFSTDNVFQEGLKSVLAAEGTADEQEEIIGRAKAYYFSQISGQELSWEAIKAASNPSSNPPSSSEEQRPLTLAELTNLIQTGQTHLIPNNKLLPSGTSAESPSPSSAGLRKKPWETV